MRSRTAILTSMSRKRHRVFPLIKNWLSKGVPQPFDIIIMLYKNQLVLFEKNIKTFS